MKKVASCDAYIFATHRHSTMPSHAGLELQLPLDVQVGYGDVGDNPHLPHFGNKVAGTIHYWDYDTILESPQMWAVVDSGGAIQVMWEGETQVDEWNNEKNPIYQKNYAGETIIPSGGTTIAVQFPGYDAINTDSLLNGILISVQDAAIPGWVPGTVLENYITGEALLNAIYQRFQVQRGLTQYAGIETTFKYRLETNRLKWYVLLWLRAASMILYGHRGETCIPLMKDKFIVDLTLGTLSTA